MMHSAESAILITPRVIKALKRLPDSERNAVSAALADRLFLGIEPGDSLSPYQSMLLAFILDYVRRDNMRIKAS